MKAAILHGGNDLRHETVPDPTPASNEVVLKVQACSICGSDLHAFHGAHPRIVFPRILGHEFAGEIVAVGKDVKNLKPGMRVCSDIDLSCGTCGPCREGRGNICDNLKTMGFDRDGAYAEYVATPATNVYRLPDAVTYDQAAIVQTLGISYHAVAHRVLPQPGEHVCVIGAGPIGLGAALIAALYSAEVTIVDLLDYRLDMAKKLGVHHTINAASADLVARALEITQGRRYDKVIEAVGGRQGKINSKRH
jgi:threonine dehydrogenase-like Zn-dependent dehydrogenase